MTMERPKWNKYITGKREQVRFWRDQSAYDLAARLSPDVTEVSFNDAKGLLNRIQRYALASVAQWERSNTSEPYCNSKQCGLDEERLEKRGKKLQKELGVYGVSMEFYGLYPSIIDSDSRDLNLLHFF